MFCYTCNYRYTKVLCWKLPINGGRWPHWTGDRYIELKYIVKRTGRARKWPLWPGDHYTKVTVRAGLTVHSFNLYPDLIWFLPWQFWASLHVLLSYILSLVPRFSFFLFYASWSLNTQWNLSKPNLLNFSVRNRQVFDLNRIF